MKIKATIILEIDDDLYNIEDPEEKKFFEQEVLGGELILHSNVICDEVGNISSFYNIKYL